MFWFIEDKDGNSIPGQRAKAARGQARKIWRYLDRLGRLSDCWNEADTVASSYYTGEMRRFFPDLQLCENDYKANRIATLIFPNFLKHRNSKVKEEIKEDSEYSATKNPNKVPWLSSVILRDPRHERNSWHKSNAKTARGLCLQDYICTNGSVLKRVFDTYFNSLLPADLKIWEERSAAAKQAEKKAAT
ncbi:hypothetical protein DFH08DRAFT_816505 [Mycena albidolilacea]|uniref:Uncharacterized protein n=1 Tax=Mycena albidolilacea TaxID=1033008 RepID=A0AAD6ZLN8_9AGAR|nr:hypothetical protein DFH08DRAFT_816505 [Mycena albidolilacea]